MIVRTALADATARLAAAGVADPARDARRLLDHHAGRLFPDDAVPDPDGFAALVRARGERRPIAQIVGRRAFWRHDFAVTPDVLDPRPETEALVAAALDRPWTTVLDLGTGSGCILCSLLAERDGTEGTGIDLSTDALAVARRNAAALDVAGRATFARSDWFDRVTGRFDLIVSNPPYVARDEMRDLAPELFHEPRIALTDEGDGLSAYRVLSARAPAHLTPGGRLMVEVGASQGRIVADLFDRGGLTGIAIHPDLDGRDRVVEGRAAATP
ncbi:peptide chain release factor N(5)-glutamine methyltransferase [Jannaschia sp. LMIT008]|uniref:peptide chain release factor N(5)-glutamine methyltransferase n=1 Tax=Jannaschia maritima TaxID=3032585 RepID=UPI0028126318|nr:peptide chain release factor N(5)-glutamine methyltransferase [Jannaschia sp. LMIT008]